MTAVVQEIGHRMQASLRPVARWVVVREQEGPARLEMVWSVPDPDAALPGLTTTTA